MLINRKVFYINSSVFLIFFLSFAIFNKTGFAFAFGAGYLIGFFNIFLSQLSLTNLFAQPQGGDTAKKTLFYIFKFFIKMLLLAIALIVCLKYLKLGWLGMLIGLISSTFVYLMLLTRNNRCQSSQKQ